MKNILLPILILSLALTACGTSTETESSVDANDTNIETAPSVNISTEAYVSPNMDTSYDDALSARLQLNLGSLKLAETNTPITPEQAKSMLPFWQGLFNMTRSGNSAQAEVNALLGQIEASLTPDQLAAIREMKLISADIQSWAAASGTSIGSGSGQAGTGQGGGGGGSGMSPEARATKQAAEGVTSGSNSGNGVSTALLNALISYLEGLAN